MRKSNMKHLALIAVLFTCVAVLFQPTEVAALDTDAISADSFESEATITSFEASPEFLARGESTTLSWTTDSATSCTPSGGTGGWDTLRIGLPSGSEMVTIPAAGEFEFTLTCQGTTGPSVHSTVVVEAVSTVEITSFEASPDLLIAGESTTLSWVTDGAEECLPSGSTGGWNTTEITLPSGSEIITIPAEGVYEFSLICQGVTGPLAQSTVEVEAVSAVAITSFEASLELIIEGESTTLSWTTENATSCTPSGGAGGWDSRIIELPDGSEIVTIPTEGVYQFTLTCEGVTGLPVQSMVEVEVVPDPSGCNPTLTGNTVEWADFWRDIPFPGPVWNREITQVPRKGYLAIKFNTADFIDTGLLNTIETTANSGRRLGAISRCAGDFQVEEDCQHVWGVGGEILWSTEGFADSCPLELNTTYYFNVTFTDGVDPKTTDCNDAKCFTEVEAINPEG
jgi:hypothetical protein